MSLKRLNFIKTAAQTAVFYFICILFFSDVGLTKSGAQDQTFEAVKKKAVALLIQKQKKQALSVIDDYIFQEKNKASLKEIKDFRFNIAKKFLTKEAQEAYEVSLNLTLENPKEAKKMNDECLVIDPENADCLIQKLRLIYRENPLKVNSQTDLEKLNKNFSEGDLNWVKASYEKSLPDFKNQNFFKKENTNNEDKFIKLVLEADRAFLVKNYSKSKEMLVQLEKEYKEWPDLVFYKQKMDLESTENKSITANESANLYQMKCKNLSKSIVRKFRYDFDLCLRGL